MVDKRYDKFRDNHFKEAWDYIEADEQLKIIFRANYIWKHIFLMGWHYDEFGNEVPSFEIVTDNFGYEND